MVASDFAGQGAPQVRRARKPGRLIEMDDTQKMFSNPTQRTTEDYISGRFG
jgi:ABC-type phosphate transport system ATPase subunit